MARPLSERIADAEARAGSALGNANEARERGQVRAAARYDAAAQRWLDEANRLRGLSDSSWHGPRGGRKN